ncbi:MAG: PhnD/SsuA/transferrin family substrate-binding protein [Chloroflexota bacterium]|nr:MAG: PhnD/SsuA/transferrin family substrate-binding protein [Chloroflexota bacterium]
MDTLVVTSCLAANTHVAGQAVTDYIGRELGIKAEFVVDIHWQERKRLLDSGQIQLGWICGLLYAMKAEQHDPQLELLAAPVMRDPRYQGQPVYYSDVIVQRDSPFNSFDDLKGVCWVYNEPGSYSGYTVVCHHLVKRDESLDYFGEVLESGAHLHSLQMLIDGRADVAAIDSTILDYEMQRRPALARKLRVIETLGPSPVPPWVISLKLPQELRRRLRELLLAMHTDPKGQAVLASGELSRFVSASDDGYQILRDVAKKARPVAQSA